MPHVGVNEMGAESPRPERAPIRTNLLRDRAALVTGAGSGIGRASVLALVSHGARVVSCDVDERSAAETARLANEIRSGAGRSARVDVTDAGSLERAVGFAVDAFGGLDVVHANAGISQSAAEAGVLAVDVWQRSLDVNLTGVYLTFKAAIPALLRSECASFVVTASGAGLIGVPGFGAYTASKHGVVGFVKSAALDYAGRGVRVNAVAPGTTDTPMFRSSTTEEYRAVAAAGTPIGRLAWPEEIANAVVWLASDLSSYAVGSTVVVDGGHSIV